MIEDILTTIDTFAISAAQSNFGAIAGELGEIVQIMGGIALLIILANGALQYVPVGIGSIAAWAARFVMIGFFALSWTNFQYAYDLFVKTPDAIGAAFLQGDTIGVGIDKMIEGAWTSAEESDSWFDVNLTGLLLRAISVLLGGIAVLVIGAAKLGMAVAIGLAPIFVTALMFRATAQMFATWVRFTLGFGMVLVLVPGLMSVILTIADSALIAVSGADELADFGPLLIVMFTSIFMLYKIPDLATSLSGVLVVIGSGIAQTTGVAGALSGGIADSISSARATIAQGRTMGAAAEEAGGLRDPRAAYKAMAAERSLLRSMARVQGSDERVRTASNRRLDQRKPKDTDT